MYALASLVHSPNSMSIRHHFRFLAMHFSLSLSEFLKKENENNIEMFKNKPDSFHIVRKQFLKIEAILFVKNCTYQKLFSKTGIRQTSILFFDYTKPPLSIYLSPEVTPHK